MDQESTFRQAVPREAPLIMQIIRQAQARMRAAGSSQWQDGYPAPGHISADIGRGCEYPWHIEIIDKTFPAPDYLALERESTLRGVFYSKMKACIEAAEPDSEEYFVALSALKYGLGALNDRGINDFGGEGR